MKIVCDTNILISAFVFPGGPPDQVLNLVRLKTIDLCLSPEIFTEFESVLIKKFKYTSNETQDFLERLSGLCQMAYPKKRFNLIKRVDADNRILECAVESSANYLVTGDKKDILPLKQIGQTRIVTAREFLTIYLASKK